MSEMCLTPFVDSNMVWYWFCPLCGWSQWAGRGVLMMTVCVRELGGGCWWWEYSDTVLSQPAIRTDIDSQSQCWREERDCCHDQSSWSSHLLPGQCRASYRGWGQPSHGEFSIRTDRNLLYILWGVKPAWLGRRFYCFIVLSSSNV